MKLGPYMYHLNTFHLHQNEGDSEGAGGERRQKTIRKWHEINIIWTFTGRKNSLENAMKVGFFYRNP